MTACGATSYLARRGAMAYIPNFSPSHVEAYLHERDAELGWSVSAPRADPAFPGQPACVSVYGDSFTAGSGVGDDATFAHDLAVAMNCPVENFGVGGYGSDQALMLSRSRATRDNAPVTILAHLSENILRNVNQYRNLLVSNTPLGFKPRFVLDNGSLRQLPLPVAAPADFARLRAYPDQVLASDALIRRPRRSFPYVWSLVRYLASDPHVRSAMRREPWYVPFYAADHPSRALPLTTEILASFARDAKSRSRTALIVLIPTAADLAFVKRGGAWPDQPLADGLRATGIPFVHVGPAFDASGHIDACVIYQDCNGHFSEAGNRIVAGLIKAGIDELPRMR